RTLFGIDRVANPEHAADVEQLNGVARLYLYGYVPGVAEECLAVSERAGDDVTLADLCHAAARQFQRVVGALVVEDFDDKHHTFLGRDIRRDAQLARET